MKLKEGFVLGEVAGEYMVLPSGDTMNLNVITTLNASGKFLWEQLQEETTEEKMVAAVLANYEISREAAAAYVKEFVDKLRAHDFLAE